MSIKTKKQKILVIDNYDSFTFNLVQLLGVNNQEVIVYKNDEINSRKIKMLKPDKILISPGPGRPEDSRGSLEVVDSFSDKVPILGVCLGLQVIGIVFGCKVVRAPQPVHGKTSLIYHDKKTIFKNLRSPFPATRYHSLIIDRNYISKELIISAQTDDSLIMGVRHSILPVEGIQFHPESILTKAGKKIISNWIEN